MPEWKKRYNCLSHSLLLKAWFAGEKVGEGIGRTRREARSLAAEGSIKNLASKFPHYDCAVTGHIISVYNLVIPVC